MCGLGDNGRLQGTWAGSKDVVLAPWLPACIGGVGTIWVCNRYGTDLPNFDFRDVSGDWFERHSSHMITGLLTASPGRRSYQ